MTISNQLSQSGLLDNRAHLQSSSNEVSNGVQIDTRLSKLKSIESIQSAQTLKQAAMSINMDQRLALDGRSFQFTGETLAPPAALVSGVEKVLNNIHKIPNLVESHYWSSLESDHGNIHKEMMSHFFTLQQPLTARSRVDSVISEFSEPNHLGEVKATKASLVELEMHPGCDLFRPILQELALTADMRDASVQISTEDLARSLLNASPNKNGKIRFIQWPDEHQRDMSYVESTQKLIDQLNNTGIVDGVKQFYFNDQNADWEDAVCVSMFDFFNAATDKDQQAILSLAKSNRISLYPSPIILGKILPLFVTEFPNEFKNIVGLSDQELACYPKTISAQAYLERAELRSELPYTNAYLKGVLTDGGSGSQDVYPLNKCSSESEALNFVRDKESKTAGWVIQQGVPRAKIKQLQTYSGEHPLVINNGPVLMRTTYLDCQWQGGYSILSPGEVTDLDGNLIDTQHDDSVMHASDNTAIMLQPSPDR